MSIQTIRWIVTAYMLLFLLLTTWPGARLINSVQPLVFGLPFNLFLIALMIIIALGMLTALYISEQRDEK